MYENSVGPDVGSSIRGSSIGDAVKVPRPEAVALQFDKNLQQLRQRVYSVDELATSIHEKLLGASPATDSGEKEPTPSGLFYELNAVVRECLRTCDRTEARLHEVREQLG